ncbi:MAG: hydroxymyristoyl-ACP dehydratase [Betaproteobacteria bacterium]|nr:MAG: hydroxymyristoyl-ACP dehydratase [Betaproteobacteria bacterium]
MSETTHNVPINVERIRELVPHAGKMCLLERVLACDATSICCETRSHLDRANPLRRNGHLSSVCAIEYAAQAMALHGALTAPEHNGALTAPAAGDATESARHGYLASVREMHCHARYLDQYTDELIVSARLIFDESSRMIYSFRVAAGETELVTGRAAVVLG